MPSVPRVIVNLNGIKIPHIAVTGAGRNVMQSTTYEKYFAETNPLKPTDIKLSSFNNKEPLTVRGRFRTKINILNKTGYADFFVVNDVNHSLDNLLGFESLLAFDIVQLHPALIDTQHCKLNYTTDVNTKQSIPKENPNYVPLTEKDIRSKFPSLFENRTGCMPDTEVTIELHSEAIPKQRAPYKVPFHIKKPCKEKLDEMVAMGIIEKVPPGEQITWCSPMHPVVKIKCKSKKRQNKINRNIEYQKKDIRITSDATDLNDHIKRQPRIMPCVVELKHALNNKSWFSKLDIKDAFNTIPLSKSSQKITTFTTEWGLYRYLRLNMGICIASEVYNDVMISKFADIENCKVAIDDLLISGKTIEEQDNALLKTCQRLVDLNLTLNHKSVFGQSEVTFFGMLISASGIKPTADKVQDFLESLAPQNAAELASFLGLATYFSERIPHLSTLRHAFKNLEKAGAEFSWNDAHQKAFTEIKSSLIQGCLGHYDVSKTTELWVDASPVGAAAFLIQSWPNQPNSRTLISCGSRSFNQTEQNYTQMEKEAFACLWACEHFHIYVMGTKFDLLTDNKAVKLILGNRTDTKRKTPLRIKHWRSRISRYSGMTPKHIPGVNNIADFLSRCLKHKLYVPSADILPENQFEAFAIKVNNIFSAKTSTDSSSFCTFSDLIQATENDPLLQTVKKRILANNRPTKFDAETIQPYHKFWYELNISPDGLLMRNDRIVIPSSMVTNLLNFCHKGHAGIGDTPH